MPDAAAGGDGAHAVAVQDPVQHARLLAPGQDLGQAGAIAQVAVDAVGEARRLPVLRHDDVLGGSVLDGRELLGHPLQQLVHSAGPHAHRAVDQRWDAAELVQCRIQRTSVQRSPRVQLERHAQGDAGAVARDRVRIAQGAERCGRATEPLLGGQADAAAVPQLDRVRPGLDTVGGDVGLHVHRRLAPRQAAALAHAHHVAGVLRRRDRAPVVEPERVPDDAQGQVAL